MKIKLIIGFEVTEKRLLKLGFKKKKFQYDNKPKIVYVIGRSMDQCLIEQMLNQCMILKNS